MLPARCGWPCCARGGLSSTLLCALPNLCVPLSLDRPALALSRARCNAHCPAPPPRGGGGSLSPKAVPRPGLTERAQVSCVSAGRSWWGVVAGAGCRWGSACESCFWCSLIEVSCFPSKPRPPRASNPSAKNVLAALPSAPCSPRLAQFCLGRLQFLRASGPVAPRLIQLG